MIHDPNRKYHGLLLIQIFSHYTQRCKALGVNKSNNKIDIILHLYIPFFVIILSIKNFRLPPLPNRFSSVKFIFISSIIVREFIFYSGNYVTLLTFTTIPNKKYNVPNMDKKRNRTIV